ncbi:unnamed protein product [Rangifer tarandus platyrhynchus]|uniref:Uncharacterized protein n=1 Tax=Rangifer tarandus platyrhynchus TaxID=3082113 RepID=A0AC59YYW1_RANTA
MRVTCLPESPASEPSRVDAITDSPQSQASLSPRTPFSGSESPFCSWTGRLVTGALLLRQRKLRRGRGWGRGQVGGRVPATVVARPAGRACEAQVQGRGARWGPAACRPQRGPVCRGPLAWREAGPPGLGPAAAGGSAVPGRPLLPGKMLSSSAGPQSPRAAGMWLRGRLLLFRAPHPHPDCTVMVRIFPRFIDTAAVWVCCFCKE